MEARWDVKRIFSRAFFRLLGHRPRPHGFNHSLQRLTLLCSVLLLAGAVHAQPPYPPRLQEPGDLPSSALKKKWNPGHYAQILRNNGAWTWEGRKEVFDEVGRNRDFAGVFVP
jgi:hypothetical protein